MSAIISLVLAAAYVFIIKDFANMPLLIILAACFYFLNKWLLGSTFNILSAMYSKPKILPEIKSNGIPDGERTALIQTVLAGSKEEARQALRLFEDSYSDNADKNLIAVYLSAALDSEVIEEEISIVKMLQSKYGADKFYLFHRNNYDGENRGFKWGGYHDLFRYLYNGERAVDRPFFSLKGHENGIIGDEKALLGDTKNRIKNAIISDGDNYWPRGSIVSIVKKMANPANKDYLIFQPLISISNSGESLYAKVKFWSQFMFNYEAIHNWNKFKRSNFYGKGAIRIDEYISRIIEPNIIPIDTKSHDFIEAMFLKTALVADITIAERTAANYIADLRKSDRWRVGDLQGIIRYSGRKTPTEARFIIRSLEKVILRDLFFSLFVFASILLILFPQRLWSISPIAEDLFNGIFIAVIIFAVVLPKFILPTLMDIKLSGGITFLKITKTIIRGIADTFLSTLILLQNIIYQPIIIAKNLLRIMLREKIRWTPMSVIESRTGDFSLPLYFACLLPSFFAGCALFYLIRFSFYPGAIYGNIIMIIILSWVFGPVLSWLTARKAAGHWVLNLAGLLAITVIAISGIASERLPCRQLEAIKKDIPAFWWDGGWNKIKELEAFKAKRHNEKFLWAEAQFYTAGYYYTNKDYKRAIEEYRNLIKTAPYSVRAPEAQLKAGECYNLLDRYDEAFREYEVLLVRYPHSRQCLESLLEIGELSYLRAFAAKNEQGKKELLDKSLIAYKNAYKPKGIARLSKEEEKTLRDKAANGIARTFMSLDMSMSRATAFLEYDFYGKKGRDRRLGTVDDLVNPLDKL